jgi:hypothetical protein
MLVVRPKFLFRETKKSTFNANINQNIFELTKNTKTSLQFALHLLHYFVLISSKEKHRRRQRKDFRPVLKKGEKQMKKNQNCSNSFFKKKIKLMKRRRFVAVTIFFFKYASRLDRPGRRFFPVFDRF